MIAGRVHQLEQKGNNMKQPYVVCAGNNGSMLSNAVANKIEDGYVPHGSMQVVQNNGIMLQPMILKGGKTKP